jgi:hypothetical protein
MTEPNDGQKLRAIRKLHPDLDIHPHGFGWMAVPKGTAVVVAVNLDTLAAKLAPEEAPPPQGADAP